MSEELHPAENIYNLIPKPQLDSHKPHRFLSDSNKAAVKLRATAEPRLQLTPKKAAVGVCEQQQQQQQQQRAVSSVRRVSADPEWVDHHTGHKERRPQPTYTNKKDYGKVPAYLHRLREEQKAQEEPEPKREVLRQLREEEVRALLENLKKKWSAVHHEYQRLPLVTDTQCKASRRERLEAHMKQLEDRIQSLQRFNVIYTLADPHT